MKTKTKKNFFSLLFIFFVTFMYAQITNDSQLIKANHWVYDAIYTLSFESKEVLFLDTPPISVGEIKFYLKQINYDTLSHSGKNLYDKVYNFLYTDDYLKKIKIFGKKKLAEQKAEHNYDSKITDKSDDNFKTRISADLELNPELYARTNKEIDSTVTYYYKGWPFNLPLILGVANNVTLEFDLTFGKNYETSKFTDSFTNIPFNYEQLEFEYPRYAYGNVGAFFDNWGLSATIGKEGFTVGKTSLGSVIYNSTFETDAYSVITAYSSNFKYNLIFTQVEKEKFLYLHNFNIKLFPNLKFSLTEGGLRHGPIELKFLNPAMILHSFYCSFQDFPEDAITKYNLSSNYSSYLGVTLDYYPIKNLRLYALWANTELQTSSELVSNYGKLFPDGYALQGGFNLSFPTKNSSYYAINSEILYACPFLYIKQSPDWSMVKIREDLKREKDVITWIGTPLGPDTFAFDINFEYKEPRHWSVNLGYLLTLKGEVNTDTILKTALSKSDPTDTTEYPAYYPSVSYYLGLLSEEEAIAIARKKWLSGVIEYRNDISVSSEYYFGDKFIVSAQGTYTFVKNNNHKENNFQHGFELKFSCLYKLF